MVVVRVPLGWATVVEVAVVWELTVTFGQAMARAEAARLAATGLSRLAAAGDCSPDGWFLAGDDVAVFALVAASAGDAAMASAAVAASDDVSAAAHHAWLGGMDPVTTEALTQGFSGRAYRARSHWMRRLAWHGQDFSYLLFATSCLGANAD